MKFVLLLLVAMTTLMMAQGKVESVAELRKLRALGYGSGSGHSFGGDNGRDHPNGWNNSNSTASVPAPAPVEDTTTVNEPALVSSATQNDEGGKSRAVKAGFVAAFVLAIVALALATKLFMYSCGKKNKSIPAAAATTKSVPAAHGKEDDEEEDNTDAGSEALSNP